MPRMRLRHLMLVVLYVAVILGLMMPAIRTPWPNRVQLLVPTALGVPIAMAVPLRFDLAAGAPSELGDDFLSCGRSEPLRIPGTRGYVERRADSQAARGSLGWPSHMGDSRFSCDRQLVLGDCSHPAIPDTETMPSLHENDAASKRLICGSNV